MSEPTIAQCNVCKLIFTVEAIKNHQCSAPFCIYCKSTDVVDVDGYVWECQKCLKKMSDDDMIDHLNENAYNQPYTNDKEEKDER